MIGINTIDQYAIFLNSHEPQTAFFKMSIEQIFSLNPIQNEVYVISGCFENINIIDNAKVFAILEFTKYSQAISISCSAKHNHTIHFRSFDHIIIGNNIMSFYLAFCLHQNNPQSILIIIDNDLFCNDFINELMEISDFPELVTIYENVLKNIDSNLINHDFMITLENIFKNKYLSGISCEFWIKKYLGDEDFSILKNYFEINLTIPVFYFLKDLFIRVNFHNTKDKKDILDKIDCFKKSIPNLTLIEFLKEQNSKCLCLMQVEVLKDLEYIKIKPTNSNGTTFKIKYKHLYNCNYSTNCNRYTLFLKFDKSIQSFLNFNDTNWGLIRFVNEKSILCIGISELMFQYICDLFPITVKNNIYYNYLNANLNNLFNSIPIPNIFVNSWMIIEYPIVQDLTKTTSLMQVMNYQIQPYKFEHYFNSNYSPFPITLEGSLYIIDQYFKYRPRIGILLSKSINYESENWFEIEEITGQKLYLYYEEDFYRIEEFLDKIDIIIAAGYHSKDFIQFKSFTNKLIHHLEMKNLNGFYIPFVCICFAFESLLLHYDSNIIMNEVSLGSNINLEDREFGLISNISKNNTFHNHRLSIEYKQNMLNKSNLKIIHTLNHNGKDYIATVEHKFLPIYGFQWHPFHKNTQNYIENQKFILQLISKEL
jgi:anthranilate/para-aminobenzoate synthase component II